MNQYLKHVIVIAEKLYQKETFISLAMENLESILVYTYEPIKRSMLLFYQFR